MDEDLSLIDVMPVWSVFLLLLIVINENNSSFLFCCYYLMLKILIFKMKIIIIIIIIIHSEMLKIKIINYSLFRLNVMNILCISY